jgi:2-pyrone-4,6-dicarboxylate lactonase
MAYGSQDGLAPQRGVQRLGAGPDYDEEIPMDTIPAKRDETCPGPARDPRPPTRFAMPPGAVDAHAHVVGTDLVGDRSYTPPPASGDDYMRMLDAVGSTYGVLVQISVHGTDNHVMLDVIEEQHPRLRGIAVIDPTASDAELSRLEAGGVVGLRLNAITGGGVGIGNLDRYEAICAELGWHLQMLISTERLAPIAPRLARLRVPYVVDHMGDFDVASGTEAPDWRRLVDLVRDGAWTKLSGAFRLSQSPTYADTVPFAQELVAAAPDRCVWGSDWPQVGFWGRMPNVGELLDLLDTWAPDPAARDAILTTNAHRLYGFPG